MGNPCVKPIKLKVKDDIDLEVLEKYGFKFEFGGYLALDIGNETFIRVKCDLAGKVKAFQPRKLFIEANNDEVIIDNLSIIFDLIADGILEKADY
jgi:hypothetical protein